MGFAERFADELEQVPEQFIDPSLFVPAVGPVDADVMLVGEAPGANEVEQGEPFVGRAGEVLNDVLAEIGVSREALYITNVVKVRPPNNRDPTRAEIDAWWPVLAAEIVAVDPEVIVTMGNFATKEITGTSNGISQVHGKVMRVDGRRVMPTFHPAATLYDRSKTGLLKKDLLKAFGKRETGQKGLTDF